MDDGQVVNDNKNSELDGGEGDNDNDDEKQIFVNLLRFWV